jgi:hypothetical protein
VWDTAPYLHDGRALTLTSVLTTHNPNDEHGTTSQLSSQQIAWLVAYLQSIGAPSSPGTPVGSPEASAAAIGTFFDRVFPNPFRHETSMRFAVENNASLVRIEVFNVAGQRVRTLLERRMTRGVHVVGWDTLNDDGRHVSPGLYFVRLLVNGEEKGGQKMTVLR